MTTVNSLDFENYTMFHSIRDKCQRSSGGVSFFVNNKFTARKLDIIVPKHLEVLYVSLRSNKLSKICVEYCLNWSILPWIKFN